MRSPYAYKWSLGSDAKGNRFFKGESPMESTNVDAAVGFPERAQPKRSGTRRGEDIAWHANTLVGIFKY